MKRTSLFVTVFLLVLWSFCFLFLHISSTSPRPSTFELNTPELKYNFDSTPVLLVTAFFPLASSKHTHEEYSAWLRLFFSRITTPMVVYTTKSFAPTIERLRGDLPIQIQSEFDSPFDVPPMNGLQEKYAQQHDLDSQHSIRNPELYATWNAKAWLLNHTATHHASNATQWFFWTDAGAFRENHTFSDWPNHERVDQVFAKHSERTGVAVEDLLFIPICNPPPRKPFTLNWEPKDGPLDIPCMSEGSMFGGKRRAVKWWAETFYAMHDEYLAANKFVGDDQNVFNAILFAYPKKILTIWAQDPHPVLEDAHALTIPREKCTWTKWYYYAYWLASPEERWALRQLMIKEYPNRSRYQRFLALLGIMKGKVGSGECRTLSSRSFADILDESLGRSS